MRHNNDKPLSKEKVKIYDCVTYAWVPPVDACNGYHLQDHLYSSTNSQPNGGSIVTKICKVTQTEGHEFH